MYYPFEKGLVDNGTIKFVRGFTSTHDGEDCGMPVGTPLHSPEEGTITQVGKDKFGGYWLYVTFKSGYRFLFVHISKDILGTDYYHMAKDSSRTVSRAVKAFEIVCYSGNTGNSTGPHLHHELRDKTNRSIDPKTHLTYYKNSMAQWCIDKGIKDAAASNMDAFLNKYRKDVKDAGVDPVEWWVRNGSAEIPVMYQKLIDRRDALEKEIPTLNETIAKLNASIGGLTTDRNKYQQLSAELQAKHDGQTAELNRQKIELEEAKKDLEDKGLEYDKLWQQSLNWTPKIEELEKTNHQQEQKIKTQAEIITRLEEKLRKANENTKYMGMVELIKRMLKVIADGLRDVFNKRPKKS